MAFQPLSCHICRKRVKITVIRRYLVSQNYKYEKPKVLTIYLSEKRIDFAKKTWIENQLICFYKRSNFLWRSNEKKKMDYSKPKLWYLCSEIKHKNKRKIELHFYKEITNSDAYINILKRYIPKIKELVQDPFIIIRDNASYLCSQQTKEWIKNKVKEILDWHPNSADLNPIENVWGIINGEL